MKTSKRLLAFALAVLFALLAVSCSSPDENTGDKSPESAAETPAETPDETPADETPAARTVVDHAGRTVTLPEKIERVVVADIYPLPSVLAVFFDSAEKLVGIAAPSMSAAKNSLLGELYPELLSAETGFIDGTAVNVEELMKLEPDIVFCSAGNKECFAALEQAGIPCVGISPAKWGYDAVVTLENWIATLSEIFPENDKADIVNAYSEKVYADVQSRVADIPEEEKARVFFLFQYNNETLTTSGAHFFGEYWAEAIGALNVGRELDTDNSTAVTMEQVYAWNPSHIFITNFNAAKPDDLYNNTIGAYDWSGVDAVTNGRVYKMPLGIYRTYTCGADTPVTLYWLAKCVYPERFADIDITAETKSYYKEVFGIELTDEQANSIFAPVSEASAF